MPRCHSLLLSTRVPVCSSWRNSPTVLVATKLKSASRARGQARERQEFHLRGAVATDGGGDDGGSDVGGGRHVLADTEHIRGGGLGLPVSVLRALGGGDGGICHAGGLGDSRTLGGAEWEAARIQRLHVRPYQSHLQPPRLLVAEAQLRPERPAARRRDPAGRGKARAGLHRRSTPQV